MNANKIKGTIFFSIFVFILFGVGFFKIGYVQANSLPASVSDVIGPANNIILTNNAIDNPNGDLFVGYFHAVSGKCTDQPIFLLNESYGDHGNFRVDHNEASTSYFLAYAPPDPERDVFTIGVILECVLEGSHVAYEDEFTIYVASDMDLDSSKTIPLGDPLSYLGFFTDPGPTNTWTLYVNYGDAEGEYEAGWQSWDYDENARAYELHHFYSHEGVFIVGVRAVDDRGFVSEAFMTLTVTHSPVASAGGPYNILEHGDVLLDASGSYDSEHAIISYEWDLDNDGAFDDAFVAKVATWYADDTGGPFPVWVRVTNTEGQSDTAFAYVSVANVAPTLTAPVVGTINEGQVFNYTWSFTDPGQDSWTATVDYGDASGVQTISLTGKSVSLSHKYIDNGIYTVTVTVQDDDGGQDTGTLSVTVKDTLPSIDTLVASPQTIDEGGTVSFTASFSNPNPHDSHTILWEFGDGNSAAGFLTPTNTYEDNNGLFPYTAELSITDDDGNVIIKTININVNNVAPTVSVISGASAGTTSSVINLSSNFTDQGVFDTHTATWYWGDGTTSLGKLTESNGSGTTTGYHTYSTEGDYTVYLLVEDDDGDSGNSAEFLVKIEDPTPVVSFSGNYSMPEGSDFTNTGSFYDPLSESWNATVNYGDGTVEQDLNINQDHSFNVEHKYVDNGEYDITVRVTNNYGKVGFDTINLKVYNVAPWFTWEYSIVTNAIYTMQERLFFYSPNAEITFNAQNIYDPGIEDVFTYIWDFGDGSSVNGQSVSHTYLNLGLYTVKLTVYDDDGGWYQDYINMDIRNMTPVVQIGGIGNHQVYYSEGDAIQETGHFIDIDNHPFWNASVNYGDGSGTQSLILNPDKTFVLNHIYTDEGVYDAVVTIIDPYDASGSDDMHVIVSNISPSVNAGSNFTINSGQTFIGLGSFSDPGADNWTGIVNYGDGTGDLVLPLNGDKTFNFGHAYIAEGSYTVTITINDGDGGVGSDSMTVTVDDSLQVDAYMTLNGMILTPGGFGLPCAYFGICTGGLEFHLPANVADNNLFKITNHFNSTHPELSYAELVFIGPADPNRSEYIINVELVCTKADGSTQTWTGSFTLNIEFQNIKPFVNAGTDVSIDEGGTFTASGSFVDPDSSSWSARVDYGTGEGELDLIISADNTFSLNHLYEDNGQFLVKVIVEDGEGNQGIATLTVTVNNLAPVISEITMDQAEVFEGTLVNFSASVSDAGDDSLTYYWDFGDGFSDPGLNVSHQYLNNGQYTLMLTVTDDEGASTSETMSLVVLNLAPTVDAGSNFTINTGQIFKGTGTFTDPGAESWTGSVDYGDNNGSQLLNLSGDKTFTFGYAYASEGQYTVTITIDDGDEAGQGTMVVNVDNALQVDEYMTLAGMILTPGGFGLPCAYFGICTGGLEFTLPEGMGDNAFFAINSIFNAENPELSYAELTFIGPADPTRTEYTIQVVLICTKADSSVETYSGSFTITILFENTPPDILSISASVVPVELNALINVSAEFVDPDPFDTHSAVWDWGDGATSEGSIQDGTVIGSHAYQSPGVFIMTLTVTDNWGAYDKEEFQYLVIFDPSNGFVTGGGWIISPPGAYTPDPELTGKATFGFVSKYQKGAEVPTGNTEFQFKVGILNFKSIAYDWLVIAGKKAMFKGLGTINGEGNYGFMISAIDDVVDKFRIKIWELDSESVIYDNQIGVADDVDPVMAIEGGSIVIHKAK